MKKLNYTAPEIYLELVEDDIITLSFLDTEETNLGEIPGEE